ncbi:hypothetical protein GGH19_000638 [Coemansia sp. RSA 1807]|nr:hypothetical protein GGH19_000638 [Coemansia sp. RSA 1807]
MEKRQLSEHMHPAAFAPTQKVLASVVAAIQQLETVRAGLSNSNSTRAEEIAQAKMQVEQAQTQVTEQTKELKVRQAFEAMRSVLAQAILLYFLQKGVYVLSSKLGARGATGATAKFQQCAVLHMV